MNKRAPQYDGRYAEAEAPHLRTPQMRRGALDEEHPSTLPILNDLTSLYRHQGRYAEARLL